MDLLISIASSASGDFEELDLFLEKVHMLDHVVEDVKRFGDLRLVGASRSENLYFLMEKCIRMTSMREASTCNETVRIIKSG